MNMAQMYLFLADGFEEIEALGTLDILRRASLPVKSISIMGRLEVKGAHGVPVQADALFEETDLRDAELMVLPGGMPGAKYLDEHVELRKTLLAYSAAKGTIAAICAAPMVLGKLGLLEGKRATCYPGFEEYLLGAETKGAPVECDGNIITGKGPGATFEFALALVTKFCGRAKADELRQGMMMA
jgi:4-methyl-5(b-hydroxyethyl)-thiazole monophosphate biosynthesis